MKKILLIISSIFISGNTFADQPKDWQLGFQNPASDGMRDIVNFHNNLLLPIIIAIIVFVLFSLKKKRRSPRSTNSIRFLQALNL